MLAIMPDRCKGLFAVLLLVVLLLAACTSGGEDPITPLPGSGIDTGGQAYPAGPYGTTVGQVIRNFSFPGYARLVPDSEEPDSEEPDSETVTIRLGDFYNPSGTGEVDGEPLPRVLVINVSASWCVSCKHEARSVLPEKYALYQPLGGEIMLVLADGNQPGVAAEPDDLEAWIRIFSVDYPAALDPTYQLGSLFDTSSFPANFIIDTRTMQIVEAVIGTPGAGFWQRVDTMLAAE